MYYVFEDDENCALHKLLKVAYPESLHNKFIFCKSNGNAVGRSGRLLQQGELVCLYLDVSPGNNEIHKMYHGRVWQNALEYRGKFIVIPVVSSEFIIVDAFKESGLIWHEDALAKLLGFKDYFNSSIYFDIDDVKKHRTFEKFSKLVLKRGSEGCVCCDSDLYDWNKAEYVSNRMKGLFYDVDCNEACKGYHRCNNLTLAKKSKAVLDSMNVIPINSIVKDVIPFKSKEDLWKMHDMRIDKLNKYSKWLAEMDNVTGNKYKLFKHLPR